MRSGSAKPFRRVERESEQRLTLQDLAADVAMSPFHFLRLFRAVVGTTPHQYILHTRLRRAAVRLRTSRDSISSIAWDAGFDDLSTFNRRFRRVMRTHPMAYRLNSFALGSFEKTAPEARRLT